MITDEEWNEVVAELEQELAAAADELDAIRPALPDEPA